MKVWVIDDCGYDSRGGAAEVYSTLEKAKASRPWIKEWRLERDGSWAEVVADDPKGVLNAWVIEEQDVDPA